MKTDYHLKSGFKTRILNQFRRLFKWSFIENFLVRKTHDRYPNNFWVRLMPPNYLYSKNSLREVTRREIKYLLDISDTVEHAIYFGYKDEAQETLFRLAKDKKFLIDVGVNIGSVVLNFARICPHAQIFGFEPDKRSFLKATGNIGLNTYQNLEIINKGLGETPEKVKLYRVNSENAGMNRILPETETVQSELFEFDEIEIITLDDFAKERSLARVDLIKIDVEGYELHVLRGAKQVLSLYKPALFIELDDDNLRVQSASAEGLISFLEGMEYDIRRADNKQSVRSADDFSGCHFDIICEGR